MSRVGPALAPEERRLLEEFARRARDSMGGLIERITLFGSRARGDADESSDIDVMVLIRVAPDSVGRHRRALRDLASELELQYIDEIRAPLSLVVLSTAEFDELRRRERRIARDVTEEGLPL